MALSRHHNRTRHPLSAKDLITESENYNFHPSLPLQRWLRAAKLLLIEANICEQDGDVQMAFLYLYRHADLVMVQIPKHPDFRNPAFQTDIVAAQRAVRKNIQKLELLKPRVQQAYERYLQAVERRNAETQRVHAERHDLADHLRRGSLAESEDGTYDDGMMPLKASEYSELAVDLAHREIRRRDATRRTTREAGISPGTVAARRRGIVVGPPDSDGMLDERAPPARPAKEAYQDFAPSVTARPDGRSLTATPSPPPAARTSTNKYTFQPTATTEAGHPLRTVLLPPDLRRSFLNLAHPNTARNLETCGILCGTLISNALFISHLIIPDQHSTSDTCDTTERGDNALFDYCDSHELLVCGWIHTHPSQSCFLSSRDLHTSSGYQIMLPEAIAIVCSPRHNPDWGIFRLTDPPGLQAVLHCREKATFHPHAEPNIYTDALRPGHVVEAAGLKFEVVDLRKT
ncbi:hypothetical protein BAUCODRAFT_136724 [Baudoinia panamericana UAMH 10762]|uniref:MPN domain-containing protein n=1 Tax=Baudoinia panamericana (strain UAMH 10762) TaxID=717646 RepID=M2LZS2_BAUPA|nr:uncharacterized protein BAUCODRAFT_136724 [Baudoinia panamericana UAMH 10762]EMD00213.1 hypothetical protein BAUCODRAFT_136724 [Baudoinia panamericana UAMH 10762]